MLKFDQGALPFKVQTINKLIAEQDGEGPHIHNYYEMIWLVRGSGTLCLDMQDWPVVPNTVFCSKPNQPHQFNIANGMEGFVFSFTDSLFRMDEYDFDWVGRVALSQLFAAGQSARVSSEMEEDMKVIVLTMIREFENELSYREELLRRYFRIYLLYLTRKLTEPVRSAEGTRETELLQKFKELLDKKFREQKMVAEYAEQLLVSPGYLNKILHKHTGYSVGQHIRQRVILEAKRMCRYSGAGLKEIAYYLGFFDPAHFSRFFKTFAGQNFTDFKRGTLSVPIDVKPNRA